METTDETSEMEIALEQAIQEERQAYQGMGIKVLSVAGGLLGSGFLLVWVFLLFNESAFAMLIFGPGILAAAIWVDKRSETTVLDTACIGAFIAGMLMVGFGTEKLCHNDTIVAVVLLITTLVVATVTRGYMFHFLSVIVFNGCLFSIINIHNAFMAIHFLVAAVALAYTWLSLHEAECLASERGVKQIYNSWRNGLLVSLLGLLGYLSMNWMGLNQGHQEWISSVSIILVVLYGIFIVLADLGITGKKDRILVFFCCIPVLILAGFAHAVCGALLILIISFHTGHRLGLILGLLALLYFTGQYYYNLQHTLLVKSAIMATTGLLFLLGWIILKKQLGSYEKN